MMRRRPGTVGLPPRAPVPSSRARDRVRRAGSPSRFIAQAVTYAGVGGQPARAGRVLLELLPQLAHVHAQIVGLLRAGAP